jgi:hypothetical protein
MGLIFNRKKSQASTVRSDVTSSNEVERLKGKAHKTAERTNQDIEKLNSLLRANGITLNISIATGGHHRAK